MPSQERRLPSPNPIALGSSHPNLFACFEFSSYTASLTQKGDDWHLLGAPKADQRQKTESSRELLEKTLEKPMPNHEVQMNFTEFFAFCRFLRLPNLIKAARCLIPLRQRSQRGCRRGLDHTLPNTDLKDLDEDLRVNVLEINPRCRKES